MKNNVSLSAKSTIHSKVKTIYIIVIQKWCVPVIKYVCGNIKFVYEYGLGLINFSHAPPINTIRCIYV